MNTDDLTLLAIGGNLAGSFGSVREALETAVARLDAIGLPVLARSRWWRSAAWPDPAEPAFLNGVVLTRCDLPAIEILRALRGLEAQFGPREGPRNSPRVLDLDLIAHGRTVLDTPELTVPHPRAAERLFVMGPLAEIAPEWRHPVLGRTAADLAGEAETGADARPIDQ
ncbi:MAG TPA: 2-amino-4-hydroxy-6-hydroxymethyldihydropteridine diphosphokinase [Caulobacteraceae bacterium]|nr:2-amino-4-hydroxy-6-hydroxymethyldihydropteridine diphosphokinase [Caulobacteraceae bacterium]